MVIAYPFGDQTSNLLIISHKLSYYASPSHKYDMVMLFPGMEGDGEVIINPVQNCSHCESGDCHETSEGMVCYCDEELTLAPDGVSCINFTG